MSDADRIAPKAGYSTEAKQLYRHSVWEALLPAWEMAKHYDDAHVMLMPSREGLEIEHAISIGIPEDRIIAIDRSAAIIATSLWRKKFPSVKFFACEVGEAAEKINRAGYTIAAANLDFCSNFCDGLVTQFRAFRSGVKRFDFSRFAVTVAKGREGKALVSMLRAFAFEYSGFSEPRLGALMACADRGRDHGIIWSEGSYISGRVPMAWGVISDNYIIERMHADHLAEYKAYDHKKIAKEVILDAEACHPGFEWHIKKSVDWRFINKFIDRYIRDQIEEPYFTSFNDFLESVKYYGKPPKIASEYSYIDLAVKSLRQAVQCEIQTMAN